MLGRDIYNEIVAAIIDNMAANCRNGISCIIVWG